MVELNYSMSLYATIVGLHESDTFYLCVCIAIRNKLILRVVLHRQERAGAPRADPYVGLELRPHLSGYLDCGKFGTWELGQWLLMAGAGAD